MTGTTTIQASGYTIEFQRDLSQPVAEEEARKAPYRGEFVPVPFVVRGEAGLVHLRLLFRKDHEGKQDSLVHTFTVAVAPAGPFTAWTRKDASYKGSVDLPTRLLPGVVEALEVTNRSGQGVPGLPDS